VLGCVARSVLADTAVDVADTRKLDPRGAVRGNENGALPVSALRRLRAASDRKSLAIPPVAEYDSYSPTAGFGSPVLAGDSLKRRTM
jgi:hypothetical protein